MPRRFSPHDPGHFVPLRRREESVNEDVERAKLGNHGIHEDDVPTAKTPAHAAWCDEEEDRCSPGPPYQDRRMAQERPSTDASPDCAGNDYPNEGTLNCDGDSEKTKPRVRRDEPPKSECRSEEKDPLW